jgi:hypothetical protein
VTLCLVLFAIFEMAKSISRSLNWEVITKDLKVKGSVAASID